MKITVFREDTSFEIDGIKNARELHDLYCRLGDKYTFVVNEEKLERMGPRDDIGYFVGYTIQFFERFFEEDVCCLCGKTLTGYGNNPWPLKDAGKCCDKCNFELVIPRRIAMFR